MLQNSGQRSGRAWSASMGVVLAVVLALATFFSGVRIGAELDGGQNVAGWFGWSATPSVAALDDGTTTRVDLGAFWEVWDLLEKKYATGNGTVDISAQERMEGAIEGLVESYGDPYTVFLPPSDAASFSEDISGNFSGVGMEIGLRDGVLTIIAPLPDTPAEEAGLLAGDKIVAINGTSTEDMRIDTAVGLIRGERGSVVELEIYREGETDFLTIAVTRDNITIPTIETEVVDDVYIITLYSFNAIAADQFDDALRAYLKSDATALVFDLRGNPGGYLQGAVSIASRFLPAGVVVVEEQFGDPDLNEVMRSRGGPVAEFSKERLVVLVDGGSASASEIVAGALKDHGVATIIGAQTFGKGSVQELVELGDGSALKVTVARWLTPNGTSISEGGLAPDIVIGRTPQERLAGEDPQRAAALRFLAGEEVVSEDFATQLVEPEAVQATGE